MHIAGTNFEVNDDKIFFEDNKTRNGSLMTIKTNETTGFKIVIQGIILEAQEHEIPNYKLEEEINKFNKLYNKLTCGFELSLEKEDENIEKINEIFWWYTHNAMVHYSTPRGLEQTGGAAWGTRDVCQGPMEYFLMTQHYELSRQILIKIFANQFRESGEWPQWFMFDEYNMRQDDCHGDVVFWPIKSIGDYISITGDYSILDEKIGYKSLENNENIKEESILNHIKLAIESIEKRFLNDMALISYGGGDWDDTLQPANKALKERLVSSWTMALAYQSIKQIGEILETEEQEYGKKISQIAKDIKIVFSNELIKDDVIPGFAYCNEDKTIDYMLHPSDKKTGIQYRLLPMTRSIISELVDKEQADKNIELIHEKLKCPDGVRLMNRPATYKGGTIEFFQRAEQAANVGREIGLQYVHAHIRYIEAMAKLGKVDEAWKGLFTINPINIKDEVKNARIRQSNTYFSSSEGAFDTRYDFQENFDKLRSGEIEVKGGWRIYSSGPGIYLNQLVSNVLGFRLTNDFIEIDPILPIELDGLKFAYTYRNSPISIVYNIKNKDGVVKNININKNELNFDRLNNPYRKGGIKIKKDIFEQYLSDKNVVEIFI
jgi:cellobiose phosphorylase